MLPQKILRTICTITNTILFLPCLGNEILLKSLISSLELFTSMLVCVDSNKVDRTVHYIFKEEYQCWTGMHILHSTIAILGSVTYIAISFLITLTFYKNLYSTTDSASKTDSKADVLR